MKRGSYNTILIGSPFSIKRYECASAICDDCKNHEPCLTWNWDISPLYDNPENIKCDVCEENTIKCYKVLNNRTWVNI